jgi:quercetin dioxygenase-like cupin family protein
MRAYRWVLGVLLVAGALMSGPGVRSAAFVGTVDGTVTDGANPISGVTVTAYTPAGLSAGFASTNASGAYSITGLPAGTYFVRTFNVLGYVDQLHSGFDCVNCSVFSGTPVTVSDGASTNINFALTAGGGISGSVLGEGAPLAGVQVTIVDAGNQFVTTVATGAGGAFNTTTVLPAGTYFARTSNNLGFINEVSNNVPCPITCVLTSATPIVVTAGAVTSGITFDLEQGAQFTGTVTDAGLVGLVGVNLEVRTVTGQTVAIATTTAGGTYTTNPGVPAGDYFVRTSNALGLINKLNDGLPCLGFCDVDGRTPVTAPAGVVTGPIDFALDAGSRVSGLVRDTSLAPIQNVFVQIVSSSGATMSSATTDAAGAYISRDGLPPGTYYASTSNSLGFINQLHPGVTCAPNCTVALGTPIVVPATSTIGGINFTLAPGARFNGRVSGAGDISLSGVSVQVINAAGTIFASGFTGANGSYLTATGLPTGTYYLRTSNERGLINEVYPDVPCQGATCPSPSGLGTPIAVTAGDPPTTIDMDLVEGGRISGSVLEDGTSAPLNGVFVQILSLTGQFLGTTQSDALGNYISGPGLTTGSFHVRTSTSTGHINELFNNIPCGLSCALGSGTPVAVTTAVVTPGVNFSLALGGTITGHVVSGGTPLPNVTVQIVNAVTNSVSSDSTDALGQFSVRGLVDGTYYARTSSTQGHINEVFDNLQCSVNCSNILGAPLVVSGANIVSGVDFDLQPGGRVSGTVIDDATTLPISGLTVTVVDPSGLTVSTGTTNALGEYISGAGLPTGNYYVRTNNNLGLINELYAGVSCATGCVLATGTIVPVTVGSTTTNINFGLSAGGRVSGQVTDIDSGSPLQGVFVQIYYAAGRQVGGAGTDVSGTFVTGAGLTTGQYYARTSNSQGYMDQLFSGAPCVGACSVLNGTAFSVTAGTTTTGINFALTQGGRISGTVTDAGSGNPITPAGVLIFDSTGRFVSSGTVNSFGVYTTTAGLPSGTYYARSSNNQGYINELFGGAPCVGNCVVTSGAPIVVTSPGTTSGVNFQLAAGGRITGTITEAGGGPLSGVTVQIYDAAGDVVTGGATNSLGIYRTTAGLPSGTYTARTFNGQGLINELHSGTTCLGQCDVTTGTPIAVTTGAETSGIDFDLTRGARVSGTVTHALSSAPLPGINVALYDAGNVRVASGGTDGSGTFVTLEGLPAGTYFARTENSQGLVNQIHAGIDCTTACDPTTGAAIVLAGTTITGGIDFSLTPDADADADGIVNTIDLQPGVFSDAFSDVAQGGVSDGVISNRDSWSIVVSDVSPSGIQIDLGGAGTTPAAVDVCALNGTQRISLDVVGESVLYACNSTTGSTSARALNALPVIELRDPAVGPGAIVLLATGQGATVGSPVTALDNNTEPIRVIIVDAAGTEIGAFELDPGESIEVVVNPDGSVDAEVLEGVVEVTVREDAIVLEEGETHEFPAPPGPGFVFTGFFAPVANLPAVNMQTAVQTIPVQFSLGGPHGLDVLAPGFPMSQQMSCTTWTPIGPAVPTNSNGSLTYDAESGRYKYLWRTDKSWAKTCRQFQLTLTDGSTHVFNVRFR